MIILPAIDIKDGKVVRLLQGRFDEVTEYSNDPVAMAQHWESQGAEWLHVVDLNGAFEGKLKNLEIIKKIAKGIKIPIQVGGGIRRNEDILELLTSGVKRVTLGTKVVEDKKFLIGALSLGKDKIAVSLDCSKGMVAQRGWTTISNKKATDFAKELEECGLRCLIYTDIARDGMMTGPNFTGLKEILQAVKIPVIASGGVSNLEDIRKLLELEPAGVVGTIIGKAIYEEKIDLKEALLLCSRKG